MTTYSETIKERYSASEEEADSFGRLIKVQRLRPWDTAVVRKLADSDRMNVVSNVMIAACVRSITGDDGKERMFAPPKSEADVAIVMNALDGEGLEAATTAWMRLMGVKLADLVDGGEEGEAEADETDAPTKVAKSAKNSSPRS